jgi:hypothetical protein
MEHMTKYPRLSQAQAEAKLQQVSFGSAFLAMASFEGAGESAHDRIFSPLGQTRAIVAKGLKQAALNALQADHEASVTLNECEICCLRFEQAPAPLPLEEAGIEF